MPGKNFQLTPLESRRQLLLVESELNRAQLLNELRDLKGEVQHLKDQVQAAASLMSSAAKLAATFSAIGGAFTRRPHGQKEKTSWFSTLVKSARTGANIWKSWQEYGK